MEPENNEGEKMETTSRSGSLADIAALHSEKKPGSQALGVGLEARGIHAWFGQKHALADVSLDFWSGTVTALIGPSGCGKSTFLRTLNRMHENKEELLEECLERAGLWSEVKDRLNTHGGALSGGQQQRLCIARALAVRPQVLLMDEPCSALDPGSTLRIEETIGQLSSSVTIIIVTHNMQQAARVSDYTAFFLSDGGPGQMIEVGSTNEIFSRPKDQRTENYVTGRFG